VVVILFWKLNYNRETIRDVKSIATISEMPYIDYANYPMNADLQKKITNPANSVEELAMNGWIRGGALTD
jgi:hypothetical protein